MRRLLMTERIVTLKDEELYEGKNDVMVDSSSVFYYYLCNTHPPFLNRVPFMMVPMGTACNKTSLIVNIAW
jgi:hypothetical protein